LVDVCSRLKIFDIPSGFGEVETQRMVFEV
jgi:hypothetical protein